MTESNGDPSYGDPLSEPYWKAAARHRLVVQMCGSCGRHQFYPRPFCLGCLSDDLTWSAVSGRATVYSRTTVLMGPSPYTVGLIDLEEGPRLMTLLAQHGTEIGARVTVGWRDTDEGQPLLFCHAAAS